MKTLTYFLNKYSKKQLCLYQTTPTVIFTIFTISSLLAISVFGQVEENITEEKISTNMSDSSPTTYKIDLGHSSINFRVKHMGISDAWGRFNDFDGKIVYDANNPQACAVEIVVNVASVDTNQEDRDKHLRGSDFFNVKRHPQIKFISKTVTFDQDSGQYQVVGDLELLGKNKEITASVTIYGASKNNKGVDIIGAEARFSFKRSDFGMNYGTPDSVGDDVDVIVSIEGEKS